MSHGLQLSFDVVPATIQRGGRSEPAEVLGGELKIKGALRLDANLQHGDPLIITVTGADGEILAATRAEVAAPPSFAPIEEKDIGLIGYSRVHTAKPTEPVE